MAPKPSPWKKPAKQNVQQSAVELAAAAINYGEVQTEEIEVLQAIYMEDFEEVKVKNAWSKTTDRSFKLRLRSFSDPNSLVDLSVKLTATYPKTIPLLDVSGLEAYHERTQSRIRNIVTKRPKQLLGEVMIHVVASEIQEALEDALTARQQGTLPSLEEERASAEETAAELAREAEEAEERRLREAQEEEDRVLKQMVDEEVSRRDRRKSSKAPLPPPSEDAVVFDLPAVLNVGAETLQFNTVALLSVLDTQNGEDLRLGKPSGYVSCAILCEPLCHFTASQLLTCLPNVE